MADNNRLSKGDSVRNGSNCLLRPVCVLGTVGAISR
jgi:hypothetical protein